MRLDGLDTLRVGRIAHEAGLIAQARGTGLPNRVLVRGILDLRVVRARSVVVRGVGLESSVAERHRFAAGQQQAAEQKASFHFELPGSVLSDRTRPASGLFGWRARKLWAAAFPAAWSPLPSNASMRSASASGPSAR